jgi:UDP-N-acetylmuramoyl-tripeptide--D-alanyl-D-alanine ligase
MAELGANHPGEIAYLTRIAQPDVAVVTNAHPAHLEGFGTSRPSSARSSRLPRGCRMTACSSSTAISSRCGRRPRRGEGRPFRTFGQVGATSDYRAEQIVCAGTHSTFTIQGTPIRLPLPGPGNVDNALAAWAICHQLA